MHVVDNRDSNGYACLFNGLNSNEKARFFVMKEAFIYMGIGALAVNYYNNQNVHYGLSDTSERMETSFGDVRITVLYG